MTRALLFLAALLLLPPSIGLAVGLAAGVASLLAEVGAALASGLFLLLLVGALGLLWLVAPQPRRAVVLYELLERVEYGAVIDAEFKELKRAQS